MAPMWICLNDAFLSIVAHRNKPGVLLVRARRPGDIERTFPSVTTYQDEHADYRYRADIPADQVAASIAGKVEGIDYDNFKSSVTDGELHDAYMRVWSVMFGLQK